MLAPRNGAVKGRSCGISGPTVSTASERNRATGENAPNMRVRVNCPVMRETMLVMVCYSLSMPTSPGSDARCRVGRRGARRRGVTGRAATTPALRFVDGLLEAAFLIASAKAALMDDVFFAELSFPQRPS